MIDVYVAFSLSTHNGDDTPQNHVLFTSTVTYGNNCIAAEQERGSVLPYWESPVFKSKHRFFYNVPLKTVSRFL